MTKTKNEIQPMLKAYQIFILSFLLTSLFFLNSSQFCLDQYKIKLDQEKKIFFDNIMSKRFLEEEEDTEETLSGTGKVCKLGSKELKDYYKTGDLKKIELEDKKIECKEKDEDYMKALLSIVKSKAPSLRMRNLEGEPVEDNSSKKENDDDLTQNVITYGKHLLPPLVFMVIGILCIPGWIICCFCCCCNCCCCCCCKKPKCKIPCFIISYAMYALVVAVCIYGLSKSNHIFIGVADTECSILKFIDEILDGESKETTPKWAGISGIEGILTNIKTQLNELKHSCVNDLEGAKNGIHSIDNDHPGGKKIFLDEFKNFANTKLTGSLRNEYKKEYSVYKPGAYVLDIVKDFGQYDETHEIGTQESTYAYYWIEEYKGVALTADNKMDLAISSFNNILDTKFGNIMDSLDKGKKSIEDIDSSIGNIKSELSKLIVEYSETIDENGKLGVKVVFGVLALIDLGIAALVFLLCFCSGKACTKCCCCRCLCKCGVHILWNILALLMIIVFLVGSLFALIGKIGSDAMSLCSYLVSDDNIGDGKETILLGEAKSYIVTCVNGDGKIEKDLGFELDSLNSFDTLRDAEINIINARSQFNELKEHPGTYDLIKSELLKRKNLEIDYLSLKSETDGGEDIYFGELLNDLNSENQCRTHSEKWETSCNSQYACDSASDLVNNDHTGNICLNPLKCLPSNRQWVKDLEPSHTVDDNAFFEKIGVINDIKAFVDLANLLEGADTGKSFLFNLNNVYDKYINNFLKSYIDALDIFQEKISTITETLNQYTGENGNIFSFINCKFIGTNLKIILKYLKESLGGDFYTVGICLILVGCSLMLAISSTILLIIIFNIDIKEKQKENNREIPNYPMNSEGRVIRYNN